MRRPRTHIGTKGWDFCGFLVQYTRKQRTALGGRWVARTSRLAGTAAFAHVAGGQRGVNGRRRFAACRFANQVRHACGDSVLRSRR